MLEAKRINHKITLLFYLKYRYHSIAKKCFEIQQWKKRNCIKTALFHIFTYCFSEPQFVAQDSHSRFTKTPWWMSHFQSNVDFVWKVRRRVSVKTTHVCHRNTTCMRVTLSSIFLCTTWELEFRGIRKYLHSGFNLLYAYRYTKHARVIW